MHRKSFYNIVIDFEKSKGNYIYDKKTKRYYLDFNGLFSSCPLGYNDDVFCTGLFTKEINKICKVKIPNCEIKSDEATQFLDEFKSHKSISGFEYFHFTCTGGLAIESAVKTALFNNLSREKIICFQHSFHGINGYGQFLTDDIDDRIYKFSQHGNLYKIRRCNIENDFNYTEDQINELLSKILNGISLNNNAAALIIEPICSTNGDLYYYKSTLSLIRNWCTENKVVLIFDEIQTGFGSTGKFWYFEHLGFEPDIVCFGKKAQVSGIAVKEKFSKIFNHPKILEVTWDGDLIDMTRCKYILRQINDGLLESVEEVGSQFLKDINKINGVVNPRGVGFIMAFDVVKNKREEIMWKMFENGMICNKSGLNTIRLRPNLRLGFADSNKALNIIEESIKDVLK